MNRPRCVQWQIFLSSGAIVGLTIEVTEVPICAAILMLSEFQDDLIKLADKLLYQFLIHIVPPRHSQPELYEDLAI